MALTTFAELRSNIGSTVRETQGNDLIGGFLNLTLQEIAQFHTWSWLRRKTTFATVADQESYNLDEEVDRIALIRERTNPRKISYLPDHLFYKYVPNPEDRGSSVPAIYRLWEETSFSAQPTSAEAINVRSTSTADDGATFIVRIVGRESTNNLLVTESLTLDGTTPVVSTNTYAIGGLQFASKSLATTGTISIRGNTSTTTFGLISPSELTTRQKRISFYPIPSSVLTMNLEYFERVRLMVADTDIPQLDVKWNWVLREGALAKMWAYKQNEAAAAQSLALYRDGLNQMKRQDLANSDYIPCLERRTTRTPGIIRVSDSVGDNFPQYAAGWI